MSTKRQKHHNKNHSSISANKISKTDNVKKAQNNIRKENSPRKTSRRKQNKSKFSPYTIALVCMGTIAISLASFSIFTKISGTQDIVLENPSDVSSSSESSESSIDEAASSEIPDTPTITDIEEAPKEKVSDIALSGETLNSILTERTGVNENGATVGKPSIPTKILSQKLSVSPMTHKPKDEKYENKENESNTDKKGISFSSRAEEKQPEKSEQASSSKQNEGKEPEKPEEEPDTSKNKYKYSGYSNIPKWKKINSDVRGWIAIPNTNINYPVVVGPTNNYYVNKDIYKQNSRNGVIWADSDTKFGTGNQISKNTVIYGHNWTNYSANPQIGRESDVMFAQVTAFHHLDFAKKTPYFYYSTEDEEMVWQVFAAFYTEESFNYLVSDGSSEYMRNLISEAKKRSLHNYDIDVNENDKIVTLSTCTRAYGPTSKQRFVVMARKLRPGEKPFTPNITANPNFKRPNIQ